MTDLLKEYLKKNAPTFGIISAVGGFVTDVLAPLANFAFYLLLASLGGLAATGLYYMMANRDKKITKNEAALTKIVFFAFFVVIWGLLSFVHVIGPDNGVVAATVPGVESLQESLGIIQQDVKDIKADTEQILLELQDIKSDLENAHTGSITSNPDSPEEWYTNAILYASQGDDDKAVEAYEEFFAYGYPYIDAYQNFNLIARNELSKKELTNFYTDLSESQPSNVVAALMVGATEKDANKRRAHYDDVREEFGDSSVLLYWLINEYSVIGTYIYANELSASETQQWNTSDQAELKEVVQAYDRLPPTDNLEVYFINSFAYDGAKTLINSFSNQFEDEVANNMLDNPVILVTNPTSTEGESRISFVIYDSYTDILYRVPGFVDEWTSTIPDEAPSGPWGDGSADPELEATFPITPGDHTVEVYWVDANGNDSTVYTFTDAEFLSLQEWLAIDDYEPVWIYPDGSPLN